MKTKTTTITQKTTIPAHPEEIYEAFLDPKIHSKFTGSKATGKAEVGEKFTAWDGYISGRNLELKKGKRIVQEWITTEWPENYPPSKLDLSFNEANGNTELIMVHSGVPVNQKKEVEQGWIEYYWKPLRNYFEKRKRG